MHSPRISTGCTTSAPFCSSGRGGRHGGGRSRNPPRRGRGGRGRAGGTGEHERGSGGDLTFCSWLCSELLPIGCHRDRLLLATGSLYPLLRPDPRSLTPHPTPLPPPRQALPSEAQALPAPGLPAPLPGLRSRRKDGGGKGRGPRSTAAARRNRGRTRRGKRGRGRGGGGISWRSAHERGATGLAAL